MNWTTDRYKAGINLSFLLLLILFGNCAEAGEKNSRVANLPYYSEATFSPHWLSSESDSLEQFHRIPPFQLINQEGETLTEKYFENKIYISDFFFTTCPGICPKMTSNMSLLQEVFSDDADVLLLSHSVTPEIDSVSVLKAYAELQGINSDKWHLVTGDRDQIYRLGRKAYFVEEDLGLQKGADEFLHTENFVLIDKNRHIRGIYNGLNKTAIAQLIADVRTLQQQM